MLANIHVKNMALIKEADISLGKGLNILSGETGAGKSILLGSIAVALGLQNFKGFAREDADYALSELVFVIENEEQRQAQWRDCSGFHGQKSRYTADRHPWSA